MPFLSYKTKNDYVFISSINNISWLLKVCHAELVSASHMQSIKHVIASDSAAISCFTGRSCIARDCFVVPPRNDMREMAVDSHFLINSLN